MIDLKFLCTGAFLFCASFIYSADRYWVGTTNNNWNEIGNWSTSSGGGSGASVPGSSDRALFNSSGNINCTLDMAPTVQAIDISVGFTAIIDLNGNNLTVNGSTTNDFEDGTFNNTSGGSLSVTCTGTTYLRGSTFNPNLTVVSSRLYLNGSVFNGTADLTKNGASDDQGTGGNTFNGVTSFSCTSTGYLMTGNTTSDIFNGVLTLTNTGTRGIYLAYNSAGTQFNQDIILNNTGTLGIRFGQSTNGSATLAATRTITVGGTGFTAGELRFKDFTQTGGTAQNIALTGTAYLYMDGCDWGGNVIFSAPRVYTADSRYRSTVDITKNGASDDTSPGGNTFDGNTTLTCSSTGYIRMGNGNPDVFGANLTLNNSGTRGIYLAYNSAGNTIAGNLIATNTGTGTSTWIYLSDATASTLAVTGNVDITVSGTSTTCVARLGNTGDVTVGGNVTWNKTSSSTTTDCYIANSAASTVDITGDLTYSQSGAGTNSRMYIGNQGDVSIGGITTITNASTATTNHIYCNNSSGSVGTYGGNIIVNSGVAGADGVRFGDAGGMATLAATRTITVGGSGFSSGDLRFRNFTQTGATAQTLAISGTEYLYIYDCDWGGDVTFSSPRMITRGTHYRGTATITKNGASDDRSAGGNTFDGNTILNCTNAGYILMGDGTADTFGANLTMNNSGTRGMYLGYNATGNVVTGDLTLSNTGTGTSAWIYISDLTASTVAIGGDVNVTAAGSASTAEIRIGNTGDVTIAGNVTWSKTSTGTNSNNYVANAAASAVVIDGNFTYSQSTAGTNSYLYLGSSGDISIAGTTTLSNASTATNNHIYCNNSVGSVGAYGGNIIISSTGASSDGIRFGSSGGSATLAATRTVTAGIGGFTTGDLYFRNFTQVGATAQTFLNSGSGYIYNWDSDWGGNVDFTAGRIYTRGTTYQGTLNLTKTNTGNDQSVGGNTVTGNAILINSGSGQFLMGNGFPDVFGGDVTMNNIGTNNMYLAYRAPGNTIAGNLLMNNSGTGTTNYMYLCSVDTSNLTVTGNVTLNNSSTASPTAYCYIGQVGDITIGGNLTLTNTSTATNPYIYVADNALSSVNVAGDFSLTSTSAGANSNNYIGNSGDLTIGGTFTSLNQATGTSGHVYVANSATSTVNITGVSTIENTGGLTTKRTYLGNLGDVTFGGDLDIENTSTAANSQVYCNHQAGSVNTYNGNITLESSGASSDGILFGTSGTGGSGTLAATLTVAASGGGITSGDIYFRNFTQVGATAQTLFNSGTGYIYNYDSNWGGNVDFTAGRINTRGTTYQGTCTLTKTGASDDNCVGGNTFAGDVILNDSGTDYLLMGNGSPDVFSANLTMNNTSTDNMYLAYNSAGNTIAGDLVINNASTGATNYIYVSDIVGSTLSIAGNATINNTSTATSSNLYFGDDGSVSLTGNLVYSNTASGTTSNIVVGQIATSTVTIGGDATMTNSGSGTNSNMYFGNNGDVSLTGNLILSNTTTGANGHTYLANAAVSSVTIGGAALVTNTGSGTTKRVYFGNYGDISVTGQLSLLNSSSATNSQIYCNDRSGSVATYDGDIILESSNAASDGVYFGLNAGSATLAATRTISVGGGGFISGDIYLRNFTQIGPTAQTLINTGIGYVYNWDSDWGGNVVFSAGRMYTRGTTYQGTATLSKTGASDDGSVGGNTFTGDAILNNSGSRYFMMGNGSPDTFGADVTMNNTGTYNMYLAYNSAGNTIAGDLTVNHASTGTNSYIYISDLAASTLTIGGNAIMNNTSSASNSIIHFSDDGDITITGDLTLNNSPSGAAGHIYASNVATSALVIGGNTNITNAGTGATKRVYFGNQGDITQSGNLSISNTSTATNSQVYCNHNANSVATYGGNITIESTNIATDGVFFGNASGSATLAATRTISVGGGGFIGGDIYLRNFTQIGPTAQTLVNTGIGYVYNWDSDWGGNVVFSGGRLYTRGTTYQGTASLSKTGATDDSSPGGNSFTGDVILNNSGTGYFLMGNGTSDTYGANVTMNNTGTYNMYIAYNSAGNSITGDLVINHSTSGTNSYVYASDLVGSTLTIGGNAEVNVSSTASNSNIYFADDGSISLSGNLILNQNGTGTSSHIYASNVATAVLSIGGNTTITNSGGLTTKRVYFGNQGDITQTGSLSISNSSSATNSQVYCNHGANSVATYGGDITLESTNAACDGVFFGNGTGSATLAATRIIAVGGGGFISGDIYLRNFTQVGPTAQTLTNTGIGYIYNYDSDWGGNVSFSSGRMYTRGTTYQGTSTLSKTGASDDASPGGNAFTGDVILNNSGSRYFGMGNGSPDTYGANVTMNNSGTYNMYLGQNSAGNTIAGNLVVNNSGSGTTNTSYISNASASTVTVGGTGTFTNTSTATTSYIYVGEQGDMTFGNNVTLTNSGTGTNGYVYLANNTNSSVTITGNLTATNTGSGTNKNIAVGSVGDVSLSGDLTVSHTPSSTNGHFYMANSAASVVSIGGNVDFTHGGAGTTKRAYLGQYGDLSITGNLDISNGSSATNSEVFLNDRTGSVNTYGGSITVESTHASCDGIRFGQNGGSGTLAAAQTITVGGSGFIAGELRFRNFTQTGATAQALTLTGTGYMYHYDAAWGGNVTFAAPRYYTRTTTYSGTTSMEKTGATDDASPGGNTFTGDCIMLNSGTGYFLMGNGTADTWGGDLTMTTTGSDHSYIAHNSAGNSIAGNLVSTNNGASGTVYHYISTNTASTLSIGGDATLTNSGAATNTNTYFGSTGDVSLTGNLTATNSASGTNGYIYVANAAASTVTIGGTATLSNSGGNTTKRIYLGSSGDVTITGDLSITNASSANNSQFYCNNSTGSVGTYNGNITIESTNASCDGVYFGNSNGTATQSAGGSISTGGGGYISGELQFRNFTQLGTGASTLSLTGTARYYPYTSTFGGNMTVTTPRYYSRTTIYSGDFSLTLTGSTANDSYGDNVFNGNVTVNMGSTNRLRLANNVANDYNGNATFTRTAGTLQPSYNQPSTFGGDINVSSNSQLYFGQGNGTVVWDGSTAQTFNDLGASGITLVRRMTLNNNSTGVTLNAPIEIPTTVTFTDGVLYTSTANLIYFRDGATETGASDASHVDGPVEKIGNDDFTFPTGDNGLYREIRIASHSPSSTSARFRAQYYDVDPSGTYDWSSREPGIDHISTREYWILDQISGSNTVYVWLYWDTNSGGVTDLSEVLVSRWSAGMWRNHGGTSPQGNTTAGRVRSTARVTSFSPFTLASSTNNNPLPIELTLFEAVKKENNVQLTWSTSAEINNDYFVIEKTKDLKSFEVVGQIAGNGTTNLTSEYETIDEQPYEGISYYRLTQVDFDGKKQHFDLQKIELNQEDMHSNDLAVYPIPNNGKSVFIKTSSIFGENVTVSVIDFIGKSYSMDFTIDDRGEYSIIEIEMNKKLAAGSYMINVSNNGKNQQHRLIVK